jgi:AP endonuclease-1
MNIPGYDAPDVVKGRIVTLEFKTLFVVGTYVPNAGEKLKVKSLRCFPYKSSADCPLQNMERKKAWNEAFEAYIRSMDAKKPIIWLGDLNVVPTALGGYPSLHTHFGPHSITLQYVDIKNDKANWNKSAGYTEIEVNAFKRTLAPSPSISGSQRLVDVWRERHPDDEHYTYFSYRFQTRAKQTGWRLDFCRFHCLYS